MGYVPDPVRSPAFLILAADAVPMLFIAAAYRGSLDSGGDFARSESALTTALEAIHRLSRVSLRCRACHACVGCFLARLNEPAVRFRHARVGTNARYTPACFCLSTTAGRTAKQIDRA